MLVWTQLVFLPSPEGVSKGPGRVETSCLPGEKKFLLRPSGPRIDPTQMLCGFPQGTLTYPPTEFPTCLETLGWALHVGEWKSMWDTGKGVGQRAWIEGSMRV